MDFEPELHRLNKSYKECVANTINAALKQSKIGSGESHSGSEFCLKEKNAFYSFLYDKHRPQYENIMRINENTL